MNISIVLDVLVDPSIRILDREVKMKRNISKEEEFGGEQEREESEEDVERTAKLLYEKELL